MAQFAAPFAAALAEHMGLVCFDPQVECLWDLQRCMTGMLQLVGWRQTTELLTPEELGELAERASDRLRPSGFEPWASPDGFWRGWRLARPGAGGLVGVEWRQIGERQPGARFRAWLNVRNEPFERLLGQCPYLNLPSRTWTWSSALDRSKAPRARPFRARSSRA